MDFVNHRVTLAARPVGLPKSSDFVFEEAPVRDPDAGELLVKNRYISLDPAMRGWMNEARSYIQPIRLGDVFRALAIGEVVAVNEAGFAPGEHVVGLFGVQEYATVAAKEVTKILPVAPLPVFLNVLGMPGLTAYFGLLDVGKPQAGETVVVSAAAGAVGSVVGQIAKIKGCRAVGIAGGAAKCDYLRSLGFDAAIDYKTEDVAAKLREHCPNGIHVYFDNVGGDILDAALARLAMHARVVICGAISQYNIATDKITGPSNYLALLIQRASMTGMLVMDYAARFPQAIGEMAGWMAAGKLSAREHIEKGLATFPEALLRLFSGAHTGKLILEV